MSGLLLDIQSRMWDRREEVKCVIAASGEHDRLNRHIDDLIVRRGNSQQIATCPTGRDLAAVRGACRRETHASKADLA